MNISHMLYEYEATLSFIQSLVERGRTEAAVRELEKLRKEIESDYITSLAL